MASSSDSCRPSLARRAAKRARGVRAVWAAFALACASGETGDPCFSGAECASGSCGFGSCDSGLFELLEDLAEEPEHEPSYSEPAEPFPDAPACGRLDESTCDATAGCFVRITCIAPGGCIAAASSDEFVACTSCYSNGCGEPCTRVYQCERW